MEISGRKISVKQPPFVVAEISCCHSGNIENAKKLIKLAKDVGADAVKTQCYTADTITLKYSTPDFIVKDGLWKGRSLWELYDKAHTPFEWHPDLYRYARDEGITIFSSVFDKSAVDYLEKLDCPAYKIASMEVTDTGLISHAAQTGKPLIISTGMASELEILDAYEACGKQGAFLHCMSEYPGTIESAGLGRMKWLSNIVPKCVVGLSDHSQGYVVAVAAIAMGACIIEKHVRLWGVNSEDDEFAMDGESFAEMTDVLERMWRGLKKTEHVDNPSRQFRRSLYVVKDIKRGEPFTPLNIRSVRPGYGLPCKMFDYVMDRKAVRDYRAGEPLKDVV